MIVLAGLALFAATIPAYSAKGISELKFNNQSISANIEGATLETILNKIIAKKGIWFKGSQSALQEEVNTRFVDFPIEYGLKKILRNLNYSLIFDGNQSVVGVIVLDRNAEKESILENNRTTLSMEENTENDFSVDSQVTQIEQEGQDENTADTELPFLPHDYQYE
jgi:type II secretory pathway pseudopilin PulG